ncbi:ATP-binding protein [Streptosporangium sp. NPDC049644]|uniref:sensor histidine kinase n=1 Tax=Streptosporangium sp. NPDC049644 TaxID=3155507 RepID=UPI003425DC4B
MRLGLRMRLTLLYGVLFFVAGSTLVWFTYLLTAKALNQRFLTGSQKIIEEAEDPPPQQALTGLRLRTQPQDVEARATGVLDEMLRSSLLIMVLVGIVATVVGYLIADRALRPLDRVTETAQRLSEGNLHERIALRGRPRDEIKRLADTFDAMLDRLHRVFEAQRRFIANASHELRTPLAINRTVLEVSLEEPEASPDLKALARALLGTNARHERLIEGLLLLAQSEQELTSRRPLELDQVVRAALDQLDPVPRNRPVTIHRDLSPVTVDGDPLLLERAVCNLVENAIKYNVRDGQVWISCDRGGLVVENTGQSVPPYEVADLFEPFRRLQGDRVRSARGAGLGLSIVRAIVDAHGGTVGATARPEGGLRVAIALPVPATPSTDSGGTRIPVRTG